MNRNDTVLQLAILLVVIAILGMVLLKRQWFSLFGSDMSWSWSTAIIATENVPVAVDPVLPAATTTIKPWVSLVSEYFESLQESKYKEACSLLTADRCTPIRQAAVDLFAIEHQKYVDGFEEVIIKDSGQVSSQWNHVVCVKYSYRLKADARPDKIREIMAFYVTPTDNTYRIASRVCEKKYKEWRGETRCPIIAPISYCRQLIGIGN